ncbi:hypothetical protein ATL39_0161 [Sinobaca qinghaiensis]|uniref:Uncharacterized protein n=1 Tax=Sinobaca qinghaiensis TaxID=342944 RepID=A0A419V7A5_9BACL|nr:hypothetical protein [Sinobaca qinghaiensis]RKD75951.1 hypothetical protein ATL39_0161 [Sinobaca qinghaiensis]
MEKGRKLTLGSLLLLTLTAGSLALGFSIGTPLVSVSIIVVLLLLAAYGTKS